MKLVFQSCLLIGLFLLISGCGPKVEKTAILGKWQGINVEYPDEAWTYKGGTKSASAMYFEFREDDTYSGTDITGTPETGKYSSLGNMLYLTPNGGSERALELEAISENEIVFNLNPGAIAVKLTLKRK